MSANLSSKPANSQQPKKSLAVRLGTGLLYSLWVVAGIGLAQGLAYAFLYVLQWLNVPFDIMNPVVLTAVVLACVYAITLGIVIGLPWWVRKRRTSKQELGLTRLPSWMDIALAPAGLVVYLPIALLLMFVAQLVIPGFRPDEVQQIGFEGISYHYEYLLAFVTLIIVAPVVEEVLFRGYLQGKLRRFLPFWLVALVTSAVFALVHGQWNVAVDVFALGLILSGLREMTGSIWAGVLLHMLKNSIAFYFLFVSPINL